MGRVSAGTLAFLCLIPVLGAEPLARAETCSGTPGTLFFGTATAQPKTTSPLVQRDSNSQVVPPNCGAATGAGAPIGVNGDPYAFNDADGTPRYACLSVPQNQNACSNLPLVVYIHPSLFTPDTLYTSTDIPELIDSANLSNDPNCPGFILLAPQGRDTKHFYPSPDHQGLGWDNWFRPADPSTNVDVATIDHFINKVVELGVTDKSGNAVHPDQGRIYLTGWSNGSAMAIYYGQVRPSLIAAIGVYSAPNPYGEFNDPCPLVIDFNTPTAVSLDPDKHKIDGVPATPILHIHNDCDIAGICPGGEALARVLVNSGAEFNDQLVDGALQPAGECLSQDLVVERGCDRNPFYSPTEGGSAGIGLDVTAGTVNHTRWPHTWTPHLLHFFQLHPKK